VVLRVRGSTGSLGKLTLQRDCGVSWRYQGHSAHNLKWLGSDSGWMTSNPEVISSLGLVPKYARGTTESIPEHKPTCRYRSPCCNLLYFRVAGHPPIDRQLQLAC
jgi:hypothetical protein